jgi:hypothetical protein
MHDSVAQIRFDCPDEVFHLEMTRYDREEPMPNEKPKVPIFEPFFEEDPEQPERIRLHEHYTYHRIELNADTKVWGQKAYWSLDEATALSFGKAPEHVSWDWVEESQGQSPFADQYAERRGLIQAAQESHVFSEPFPPRIFLSWASHHGIEIPKILAEAVQAREVQIDDLQSERDQLTETCSELRRELRDARYQIDVYRTGSVGDDKPKPDVDRPLKARERESLYKILIGIAVTSYGHNPYGPKSTRMTKTIAGDVHLQGLQVDEDTVRKYLDEAAELLPPEAVERLTKPNSV